MLHITIASVRAAGACSGRYRVFLTAAKAAGYGDLDPIPLTFVLDSNGLDDTLWAMRAVVPAEAAEGQRIARLYACDCAERVLPLFEARFPDDKRPRQAIETARRYVRGEATRHDLWIASSDAAFAAANAACGASSADAASSAAAYAAYAVADYAAYAAADAAADADAAIDASAERVWQEQRLREVLA